MRLRFSSLRRFVAVVVPLACTATACASSSRGRIEPPSSAPAASLRSERPSAGVGISGDSKGDPAVSLTLSAADQATAARIEAERAATQSMTTDDFERRYALPFRDAIPYAPLAAAGLASIEAKNGALLPGEKARLARDGFAILANERHWSFGEAYAGAFKKHLPVYISADAILFAVHKSFDALLKIVERDVLARELGTVVARMRGALKEAAPGTTTAEASADIDDYLAVAASLLGGQPIDPIASGHGARVRALVAQAVAADGAAQVPLFGGLRDVDFSQFKPRGHYVDTPALERYFRATMWLSRTELRIVEVTPGGGQVFHRRQLEAALALRALMDETTRESWTRIDRAIGAFVGEPDEMNVRGLDALVRELGLTRETDLAATRDDAIVATLARTGLGQQRIASQLMERSPGGQGTLPLHTSFALLNQRYTLDAHVLSSVSYDRVRAGKAKRMMPDPLDVGFAALGNDGAAEILRGGLDRYEYAPDLHMMRVLATAHGEDYWQKSLYTTWSSALRALSPTAASLGDPKKGGLPSVAATRAWNARVLNTQLASWAELRHDTVLYSKPSASAILSCEFPDAYVDPYPDFFHRIALHARLGRQLASEALASNEAVATMARRYFTKLDEVATKLERMAKQEREGKPFTRAQMAFVNDMITSYTVGCGSMEFTGWYGDLFLDQAGLHDFSPVITDVHTQPADESGNPVGRVLHVGTGLVNGVVVTVDSCHGPRAYAGFVSSFYEKTTTSFARMTDEEWLAEAHAAPRPPWMTSLLTP